MNSRLVDFNSASLKDFQQHTVRHVLDRLYDAQDSTGRFLVADEVGMGKTLVARGVIAGAIERLEREDSVDRIDIIYICSNSAIAKQNVGKLNVLGSGSKLLTTRITMLASQVKDLSLRTSDRKTVNLIAFTPGTSFDKGFARGKVEERVLMYKMLRPLFPNSLRGLRCLMRFDVKNETWQYHSERSDRLANVDAGISMRFAAVVRESPAWEVLTSTVQSLNTTSVIPKGQKRSAARLIGTLRNHLAKVSIDALEPDLVILDEFQRFKELLEPLSAESEEDDIRQLAQQLFNYPDVRVLLLSATPYKLFTVSGEESISGDDHYRDFLATTRFLVRDDGSHVAEIEAAFSDYRMALISGSDVTDARDRAQKQLRRVMSRTERPTIGESHMGLELPSELDAPTSDELVGFAAIDRLAMDLGTHLPVDYWKSAPYFLNFMSGYQMGERFKEAIEEGEQNTIPPTAQIIEPHQIRQRHLVEPGNARLRQLQHDVVESGIWRLLWLPASMPYVESGGPYAAVDRNSLTKRLIFSSWAAAPNSIVALLSHEVNRRVFAGTGEEVNPFENSARLEYRTGADVGSGMTTLALVTPIPALAALTDPLDLVKAGDGRPVTVEAAVSIIARRVMSRIPAVKDGQPRATRESWYWIFPFMFMQSDELDCLSQAGVHDDESSRGDSTARTASLEHAGGVRDRAVGSPPEDIAETLAMLGMFGPGNIAYRALKRTLHGKAPKEETILRAAAVIGEGFRSLFNRPESMALVDAAHPRSDEPYWRRVLAYCADGDLQSVVDEYLAHRVVNSDLQSDEDVVAFAADIRDSMSLKGSTVQLFNPRSPAEPFHVSTRFAVRYGNARGQSKADDKTENRMSAVQQAFNSPFWPMVLASTSVGQEGVDFHWWCHSLVHWNLPSNPVDLEQREGRIHRFQGHAVRKNVAAAFRSEALVSDHPNLWVALFDAAVEARSAEIADSIGDLWPWWVFPGEAKIMTWTPTLPFSRDIERDQRMRRLREIYRLAFGQPRQEDLLGLLSIEVENIAPLDLRPPRL